jgi:hypothetical protein
VLNGVTCAGAGDCWTVGFSAPSTVVKQPLIEHYAGSSWAIVRTPNPSPGYLNAVTCVSAGDCWAVGLSGSLGDGPPLIEHYTGSRWAIASTPDPSPGVLNGVTCASAGDCWAVGFYAYSTVATVARQPLIEHYAGSSWTTVRTPNPN